MHVSVGTIVCSGLVFLRFLALDYFSSGFQFHFSYDQKCRLLNSFNWSCLISLFHPTDKPINPALGLSATGKPIQIDGDLDSHGPEAQEVPFGYRPHRIDVYQEHRADSSAFDAEFRRPQSSEVAYHLVDEAITIPSVKPNSKLPNPKVCAVENDVR